MTTLSKVKKGKEIVSIISHDYIKKKVSEIKVHNEISSIFKINDEILKKIIISMNEKGFDNSQPLVIGSIKDIGEFLVDGHTRLEASKRVGLEKVPIQIKYFETIEDAIHYTYARQAERRNLTDEEIIQAVHLLDNKSTRDGKGRSSEELATSLGVSASTIVHAKTVEKKASSEDLEAIKKGEVSINKVYQKIREPKPKVEENTENQIDNKINENLSTEQLIETKPIEENLKERIEEEKVIIDNGSEESLEKYKENENVKLNKKKEKKEKNISIDDILILLIEKKETNAIKIILDKFKDSFSEITLAEIKL